MATASFAKNYIGSRPQLAPTSMKRVGGGYSTLPAGAVDEIEGLYGLVERLRTEKEQAEAEAASATAAAERARREHQRFADEVSRMRNGRARAIEELETAQAALADRGLELDAVTQRASALEAQAEAATASQRAALDHAAVAQGEATKATARAAEREKQMEVLMQALRERTAELERVREREAATEAASAQLRDQHRREFEAVSHRAGDVERELRRTLASTEQRHAGCTHATVGTV